MHPPLDRSPRRWNRPVPVAFRPLISGRIYRPACRRPNLDRPLGPNVEKIRRSLEAARYLQLLERGAPHSALIEAAIPVVVNDWIDSLTSTAPADEGEASSLKWPPPRRPDDGLA
jgi:hypothetical protein